MKILWDEPKRIANISKHGMDFAVLTEDFFEHSTVVSMRSASAVERRLS